jgi:hypothetical protein
MAPNCFVIRTSDDEKAWVWEEMQGGRLRQGWGISGTGLPPKASPGEVTEWCDRFRRNGEAAWKEQISDDAARKRFWILHSMTKIEPGDLIIVPKMPSWGSFCLTRAVGRYQFDDAPRDPPLDDDLRHVIPVDKEFLLCFPHEDNVTAQLISAGLKGYRSAVNVVQNESFREEAIKLVDLRPGGSGKDLIEGLAEVFSRDALSRVMAELTRISPQKLEDVIERILTRAGYEIVATNQHDGQGGDADIVAKAKLPEIADVVFEQQAILLVQIKQKAGIDSDDASGVMQLVKISGTYPGAALALVSTAEEFTQGCKLIAAEHKVQLISRREVARLALKYLL